MNRFFKSFLENSKNENAEVREGDGTLLKGCLAMYQATNEMFYKDYILEYTDKLIDHTGKIKGYENGNFTLEHMNLGSTLIWVYTQTKEEKFKLAIDTLRQRVHEFKMEWKEDIQGGYRKGNMELLYSIQPFYMEYGTRYENKECYQDIITQFENARKYLFNSNQLLIQSKNDEAKLKNIALHDEDSSACETIAEYLMALIDAMDVTSIEIFEHYKLLEGYFKETIRILLKYLCEKNNNEARNVLDEEASVKIANAKLVYAKFAYVIMKACQMKVLLSEKYYSVAEDLLENLADVFHQQQKTNQGNKKLDELWDNRRMAGILMMTYSQYMLGSKTKKIKELGCCYEQ